MKEGDIFDTYLLLNTLIPPATTGVANDGLKVPEACSSYMLMLMWQSSGLGWGNSVANNATWGIAPQEVVTNFYEEKLKAKQVRITLGGQETVFTI